MPHTVKQVSQVPRTITCISSLERAKDAMTDATKALRIKPESSRAIIARGEALYTMGEFEKGLLQFQRGWRMRPHPMMKTGLQKCKDAIANAVGPNAKEFDVELVQKVIEREEKDKRERAGVRKESQDPMQLLSKKKLNLLRMKREVKRRKVDRLLLGDVAVDASFLRRLAGVDVDQEATEFTKCQESIIKIAKDALGYLEKRKNFWQQIAICQD